MARMYVHGMSLEWCYWSRENFKVHCIWKMCVFVVTSVLLHSRLTFKMYFPHDPKGIQ